MNDIREDKAHQEAPRASVISHDLRIEGELKSGGEVRIDGTIEGDVQATHIVIGEKGSLTGNVAADTIVVHGFVCGDIKARGVELKATAHVVGDTIHGELRVEKGACLDGNFIRTGKDQAAPKAPPDDA